MTPSLADRPRLRLLLGSSAERAPRSVSVLARSLGVIRLRPADPRIALALHAAQAAPGSIRAGSSVAPGPKTRPRTFDEILAMEQGRGWGQVFKALKSQGLIEEQTLGHVLARWIQRTRS